MLIYQKKAKKQKTKHYVPFLYVISATRNRIEIKMGKKVT